MDISNLLRPHTGIMGYYDLKNRKDIPMVCKHAFGISI